MKIQWKRLLSALLVLVMVLSVLPAAAFASSGDSVALTINYQVKSPSGDSNSSAGGSSTSARITSGELSFSTFASTKVPYGTLITTDNIKITYSDGEDTGLTGKMVNNRLVINNPKLLSESWNGKRLYATLVFQENTYTVSLNGQPEATGLRYSDTYTLPKIPEIPGKQAVGWSFAGSLYKAGTDLRLSSVISKLSQGVTEINLVPVYEDVKDYLVLWVDSLSGEIYGYETVDAGETATPLQNPAKAGYTFGGWDKTTTDPITENTVFYAKWTANDYGITYGNLTRDTQPTANTGDVVNVTVTPSAGHRIDGVYVKGESGTFYTVNPTSDGTVYQFTMPAESVTVWATETASRLTATFRVDGSVTKTQELDYGTAPEAPADPTKQGYTFKGWKAQSDNTVYAQGTALASLTANEVYDAVFEAEGYTLTYYRGAEADNSESKCVLKLADGTSVEFFNNDAAGNKATYEAGSFKVGDTVTLAEPVLPGYRFQGWQDEDGYTHPAGAKFTMPAKHVQLTALWAKDEAQTVLVRFVSQGALYDAFLAYEGDTVQIPAQDPTAQGKVFGGWKFGENTYSNTGVKKFEVAGNDAREMTLEAQWTDETYTVTYDVDGTSTSVDGLSYGEEIVLEDAPEKEGYTFQAWKRKKNLLPII